MNTRDPTITAAAPGVSDALPASPFNLRRAVERFEQGFLHNIMILADGNQQQAADMLGISLAGLQEKMSYYEL